MAGVYDFPDDSTRLKDREIKGEDEYNEELRKKREGNADNNIFEGLSDEEDADEAKEQVGELPGAGGYKGKEKKIKDVRLITLTSAFFLIRMMICKTRCAARCLSDTAKMLTLLTRTSSL
jgi:hypothetical protein